MSTPAGNFGYSYDGAGRPSSMGNPYGESTTWMYLANGWLWKQALANGATTVYTYNAKGLPTDVLNSDGGGSTLNEFSGVAYDGMANRTTYTANIAAAPSLSGLTTFGYDPKGQILQEQSTKNGGYTYSFGFDLAGNPTTFKGTVHAFNSSNQDSANTYDGSGNPTIYQGVGMTFDAENRLASVGSALTAGYRADGLRAWKQGQGSRIYFLYDESVPLIEIDPNGNVTAVNSFGPGGLVSRRFGASSTFYTFDPQGNVAQRLDAGGTVLTSCTFDAFGTAATALPANEPFGHEAQFGYYTDSETGLELLTHRYYDAAAGRFLNRDPAEYCGGVNLYGYAGSNPVNCVDPSGEFFFLVVGVVVVAAVYFFDQSPAGEPSATAPRANIFIGDVHGGLNPLGVGLNSWYVGHRLQMDGYSVRVYPRATINQVTSALPYTNFGVFYGHGGPPDISGNGSQWTSSDGDNGLTAADMIQALGKHRLDGLAMYSCWSGMRGNRFIEAVKPGGYYWGSSGSYSPGLGIDTHFGPGTDR
jgi:RHS repeat-associated protein